MFRFVDFRNFRVLLHDAMSLDVDPPLQLRDTYEVSTSTPSCQTVPSQRLQAKTHCQSSERRLEIRLLYLLQLR